MKKSNVFNSKFVTAVITTIFITFALWFFLISGITSSQNADAQSSTSNTDVAQIGETKYSTLQAAFNASQPGDTIKLLKDKITVADYGSTSYGVYTEITADSPTSTQIGTAMEQDALANVVLRKESVDTTPNMLINSYGTGDTRPTGYITIEGLENGGTQLGSLDLSGADCIKLKNLNFDSSTKIKTYCYYGTNGGKEKTTSSNKDKVTAATPPTIVDNQGGTTSIIDCNYSGGASSCPDASNSAAISIEFSNCVFTGEPTYEDNYSGILSYCQGASGYRPTDWTIDNCNFQVTAGQALSLFYLHNEAYPTANTLTITNNTFGSYESYFHGECISCGTGTYGPEVINNNVFWNWRGYNEGGESVEQPYHSGAIWVMQPSEAGPTTLTIKDNKFLYNTDTYTKLTYHTSVRIPIDQNNVQVTINDTPVNLSNLEAAYAALTNPDFGNINIGHGEYIDYLKSGKQNRIYWTLGKSDPQYYQVAFDTDGGSTAPDSQYILKDGKATKPAIDPTKPGYVFKGWYLNDEEFDFDNTPITGHTTLKAKWEDSGVTYNVKFDTSGGIHTPDPQVIPSGGTVTEPAAPTKEGYKFVTWMKGEETYDFSQAVWEDFTLTAAWKSNDGEAVIVLPDVPYDEWGNPIVEIDDEAKQQALENAEKIVTDAKAGKDAVGLTAEKNAHLQETVKLEEGESTLTILEPTVKDYNKQVPSAEQSIVSAASLPNPTIACSYDFSMTLVVKVVDSKTWALKDEFRSTLTQIDKSVDYKIRLSLPEEVYDDSAIQVLKVHQLVASDITTDCDINRTDHYADVPAYQFSTYLVNVSNSLYLSFDSQGGSEVPRQTVTYNTCATEPAAPTRDGYTFESWFNEPECETAFDFAQPLTLQKTVYAKWKQNGGGGGGDVPSNWEEIVNAGGSASTSDMTATIIITLVAIAGTCAALMLLKRKFGRK